MFFFASNASVTSLISRFWAAVIGYYQVIRMQQILDAICRKRITSSDSESTKTVAENEGSIRKSA